MDISIPYGAIKSITIRNLLRFIHISIPYGAIKRVGQYAFANSQFEFQFLMVRLKVIPK